MKYVLSCKLCKSKDLQSVEYILDGVRQLDSYICKDCEEYMEADEVIIDEEIEW